MKELTAVLQMLNSNFKEATWSSNPCMGCSHFGHVLLTSGTHCLRCKKVLKGTAQFHGGEVDQLLLTILV